MSRCTNRAAGRRSAKSSLSVLFRFNDDSNLDTHVNESKGVGDRHHDCDESIRVTRASTRTFLH